MNKNVAAYEEMIDFVDKAKNFIKSLQLSPEQIEMFFEMIKSLIIFIVAGDSFGIQAFNQNELDFIQRLENIKEKLK